MKREHSERDLENDEAMITSFCDAVIESECFPECSETYKSSTCWTFLIRQFIIVTERKTSGCQCRTADCHKTPNLS